ncbi:Uncharacterized protein GBIM_05356, partial [Gryllus bimaculatus]
MKLAEDRRNQKKQSTEAYTQYRQTVVSTGQHSNADVLLRLPVSEVREFDTSEVHCLPMDQELEQTLQHFPVNTRHIAQATDRDAVLRRTIEYVRKDWPMR